MGRYNERIISRTIYVYTFNVYAFTTDRKVEEVKVLITGPEDAKDTWLESQCKRELKRAFPDYKYLDKEQLASAVYSCEMTEREFFETASKHILEERQV